MLGLATRGYVRINSERGPVSHVSPVDGSAFLTLVDAGKRPDFGETGRDPERMTYERNKGL